MNNCYVISAGTMRQVKEFLNQNKKIGAIKALRNGYTFADGERMGLREAKHAIERFSVEHGYEPKTNYDVSEFPKLAVGPFIKRIVVDFGDGEVEVNLETMELRALMDMQTIGLDACADILDLVEGLKSFSYGMGFGGKK